MANEELTDQDLPINQVDPSDNTPDDGNDEGPSLQDEAEQLKAAQKNVKDRWQDVKDSRAPKAGAEEPGSPVNVAESNAVSQTVTKAPPVISEQAAESAEAGSEIAAAEEGAEAAGTAASSVVAPPVVAPPVVAPPVIADAAAAGAQTAAATEAATTAAASAAQVTWAKAIAGRIAAGQAKIAAAKQAALVAARKTAASMAVKKGIAGTIGKAGVAMLGEAMIPVIGWIMAILTALWLLIKTKLGRYILLGLLILLSLPTIFFIISFMAIGGVITPSSTQEKAAVTETLALTGDAGATRETILSGIDRIKTQLSSIKATAAKKYDKTKADAVNKEIDTLVAQTEAIVKATDNKEERAKLIKTLNEALTAFAAKYPEIMVAGTGKCADLKPFIDSGQFKISTGPNAKLILKGMLQNKNNGVSAASPELCGVLIYALQSGYKIQTGSFSYDHGVCTYNDCNRKDHKVSAHACGAAIDIGSINGEHVRPGNKEYVKFLETIRQGHKEGKIRIQQLISPDKSLYIGGGTFGSYTDGVHQNHVHLSSRPVNSTCMKTGKP